MLAAVQVFSKSAGETNLHSRDSFDGFWLVLSGGVRFDREPGPHEGVFVPKDTAYWFEQAGDEPLEILQVEAIETSIPAKTKMFGKPKPVAFEKFNSEAG